MFTNPVRAMLVGAAIATGLIGTGGTAAAQTRTVDNSGRRLPLAQPVPEVSLDDLQAELVALATATDPAAIQARLTGVIAALDAQAPLVPGPLEATYLWLIVKLQTLYGAVEEKPGADDGVVQKVNALATELADALAA